MNITTMTSISASIGSNRITTMTTQSTSGGYSIIKVVIVA